MRDHKGNSTFCFDDRSVLGSSQKVFGNVLQTLTLLQPPTVARSLPSLTRPHQEEDKHENETKEEDKGESLRLFGVRRRPCNIELRRM